MSLRVDHPLIQRNQVGVITEQQIQVLESLGEVESLHLVSVARRLGPLDRVYGGVALAELGVFLEGLEDLPAPLPVLGVLGGAVHVEERLDRLRPLQVVLRSELQGERTRQVRFLMPVRVFHRPRWRALLCQTSFSRSNLLTSVNPFHSQFSSEHKETFSRICNTQQQQKRNAEQFQTSLTSQESPSSYQLSSWRTTVFRHNKPKHQPCGAGLRFRVSGVFCF